LLVLQPQRLNPDQHLALNRWQGGDDAEQGLVNGKAVKTPEDSSDEEDEKSDDEQQQQRKGKEKQQAGGGAAMDVDGQQQQQQDRVPVLLLSRKQSLLSAAAEGKLPASAAEVSAGAVLPGYVASVTRDAGEGADQLGGRGVMRCLFEE
jgi:hypothetical protein